MLPTRETEAVASSLAVEIVNVCYRGAGGVEEDASRLVAVVSKGAEVVTQDAYVRRELLSRGILTPLLR